MKLVKLANKFKDNKKAVITVFLLIAVIMALLILCYMLFSKIDMLTNINYYPPEVEALLLSEINVSEHEIMPLDLVNKVIKDVDDLDTPLFSYIGETKNLDSYELMPESLQLLIDKFINGVVQRKNDDERVEEIIKTGFEFGVEKTIITFSFAYNSIIYGYTYLSDGIVRKDIIKNFNRGINEIYHHDENGEIATQIFYDFPSYMMTNTGEIIFKNHASNPRKKTYANSTNQIKVSDFELFREDYLSVLIPKDFVLTIENIVKYMEKR